MKCSDVKEKLSAYVDRELSSGEYMAIKEHLEACLLCSREEDQLRRLSHLLDEVPDDNISPLFSKKVLKEIGMLPEAPRFAFPLSPLLASLLVLIILAIGIKGLRFEGKGKAYYYEYLKDFDDFPPESFSSIYLSMFQRDFR